MKYISLIILIILAYFKKIGQTFVIQNQVFQKHTIFVLWTRSELTSWSQILPWWLSGELKFLMEIR